MTEEGYVQESWMPEALQGVEEPGGAYAERHYGFERLAVWNRAVDLVDWTYKSTSGFPGEERFILTAQIRRAAISVHSNIAEGMSRVSSKEKKHYIHIAYGSLIELLNHILIAERLGCLQDTLRAEGRQRIQELTAMLSSLRNTIKDNH